MPTVLIVDDQAGNLYLLHALLSGHGFTVREAPDGLRALESARADPPAVVISDILMPGMDGYTFCREWKADPVLKAIPFVLYTATYTDPRDEQLALSIGADRFWLKPMEPALLMTGLRELLANQPPPKPAGTTDSAKSTESDTVVLRQYNAVLIHKLEDKLAELDAAMARERRLSVMLRTVRNINQLIAREDDPDKLIQGVCDHLRRELGFSHAWVALLASGKSIIATAQSASDTAAAETLADRLKRGEWPRCARQALNNPGVVMTPDPSSTCPDCPLQTAYPGYGGMAVRLTIDEDILGVLSVARMRVATPDPEESALLAEMASDLAFALRKITRAEQQRADRVRAESALRQSEAQYRHLINNVHDIIYTLSQDGVFTFVSPSWTMLLGHPLGDVLGKPHQYFVHPEDLESCAHALRDIIATQQRIENIEYRIRHANGSWRWHAGNMVPLRDESGAMVGIEGIASDITERKELATQLAQSQKLEAVGRLAGGVAHDFNNLLMGIMGHVDLCRDRIAPDHPIRDFLNEIMRGAERSADLTRQLLAFARRQMVAPEILDLNDAIAGMLKLIGRLLGEDIHLTWIPGAKVAPVTMDPSQVDQILVNLCVNARDAIDGVGTLTIETRNAQIDAAYCETCPEAMPGEYVLLSISDSGCGMSRDVLAHIFEPFYTTKDMDKGTGLGLATVYGIVKQNQGFIKVYSEPGNGTTFSIYLPPTTAAAGALPIVAPPTEPPRGSATILLVEDEYTIRTVTERLLTGLGYKVLVAGGAAEALEIVRTFPGDIHLLLTDVIMPDMSGRDLAREFEAARPAIKTIYMSGYASSAIASHDILEAGIAFMQKPVTRKALAEKIHQALNAG